MTQGIGRAAYAIAVAVIAVVFGLAFGPELASAEKRVSETSVGQNTFVKGCRKTGGKPSRVAPRTVKCDHGDGSSTTCNFSNDPATCTYVPAFAHEPAGDHVDPGTVAGAETPSRTSDPAGGVIDRGSQGAPIVEKDQH
jgi:hypothetical protein